MVMVAKQRNISYQDFVEHYTTKPVKEGDVVCFYHANDYLGKGIVVRAVDSVVAVKLDTVALENFNQYSYRLFDHMILDDEIEMVFDEY